MNDSKSVINIEEFIGKTVGRRRVLNTMCPKESTKAKARAWQQAFPAGGSRLKGVFRFKSHEEADAWTMNQMIPAKKA